MQIPDNVLASKGQRFLNFVVDRIFFYVIMLVIGFTLGLISHATGNDSWIAWLDTVDPLTDILISSLIFLIYYFIFELAFGRTLGKFVTGTMVISSNSEKPNASQVAYRTLSRIIPFEPFSLFGERTIGWHDSNGDTLVVDVKKYNAEIEMRNSFEEIGKVID